MLKTFLENVTIPIICFDSDPSIALYNDRKNGGSPALLFLHQKQTSYWLQTRYYVYWQGLEFNVMYVCDKHICHWLIETPAQEYT